MRGRYFKHGFSAGLIVLSLASFWGLASRYDAGLRTQTVLDRHHQIIGCVNSTHQGFEFWTPLSQIPLLVAQATLHKEDRYFYWHPGINPLATLKALVANLKSAGTLRGGSTLTQQLAKMLFQDASGGYRQRTWTNKAAEALLALGLELKHSKSWILERYLNEAYYGNHCYGITAAARYYFNKNLLSLNTSEISLLVNLPQNPSQASRRIPIAKGNQRLNVGRHFVEWAARNNQAASLIETTLDLDLQKHLEEALPKILAEGLTSDSLLNAAIVVIDVGTGELRAMVGSRDYFEPSINGTYNTALALRQPGSALKPFTYFMAFSKGYTPDSLVRDEPHSFTNREDPNSEAYIPQNFDRLYHGEMTFRTALANSYNVPAVLLLNELGVGNYIDLLHKFGLTSLDKSPQYYGLSITLGSGEVTLLDLTNAYAALARGGRYQPVVFQVPSHPPPPKEIIPQAAQYAALITEILSDAKARVPAFGFNEDLLIEGINTAVKTGTSYNHNDNWAIGYNNNFAVGVWLGHSDNSPLHQTTGASGAGPLWHAAMEHLVRNTPPLAAKQEFLATTKYNASYKNTKQNAPKLPGMQDWNIISPLANNHYRLKPYIPMEHQQILARISGPVSQGVQWVLDGIPLGSSTDNQFWISPQKGEHVLEVISTTGRKQVHFNVEEDS